MVSFNESILKNNELIQRSDYLIIISWKNKTGLLISKERKPLLTDQEKSANICICLYELRTFVQSSLRKRKDLQHTDKIIDSNILILKRKKITIDNW